MGRSSKSSTGAERENGSPRKRRFRVALGVAALGAVAFVFYTQRELFEGFASALSRLNWYWVVVALLAELASIPWLAETQRLVLRAGGTESQRVRMNLLTLAANAIALSLPVGFAVAEGYWFVWFRRFGAGPAVAAWSELAAGAIAFAALAGLALAGAIIAGGSAEPILLPLLTVVFLGSVGAAALFRHPATLVRAIDWITARLRRFTSALSERLKRWRDTAHALTDVRPSFSTWATAWGMSILNWLLDAVCLALCFQAIGAPIPWGAVLLAFAGSKVITSFGITPGGLGLVEGGLVGTFVAYGSSGAEAGAAVLLYRAITLIGFAGIGWAIAGLMAAEARNDYAG
jgi:uncharacterized protein (TIRG00374 family)